MQEVVEKELFDRGNRRTIPNTEKHQRVQLNEGIKINGQKLPDPKLHQIISFIKSGIRIVACTLGIVGWYGVGFFGLLLAEIVGIYEELV